MSLVTRRLAALACLLPLASALPPAGAAQTAPRTKKKPRKRLPSPKTVRYANGETPAQRRRSEEARLKRECKGRPNAGACLGYTR